MAAADVKAPDMTKATATQTAPEARAAPHARPPLATRVARGFAFDQEFGYRHRGTLRVVANRQRFARRQPTRRDPAQRPVEIRRGVLADSEFLMRGGQLRRQIARHIDIDVADTEAAREARPT